MDYYILFREIGHFLLFLFVYTGILPLFLAGYAVYAGVKRYDKVETFIINKFPNFFKHVDYLAIFALVGLPIIIYTAVSVIQTVVHFIDPSITF